MRFPILFTGGNRAMALIGIRPASSWVEVSDEQITVRLGWAFRMRSSRDSVAGTAADFQRAWGWGAHGWSRHWLVNGSSHNLVRIELDPPARGWVLGLPVRVEVLRVSLVDPDAFLGEIRRRGSGR